MDRTKRTYPLALLILKLSIHPYYTDCDVVIISAEIEMPRILSDAEIQQLLQEQKPLPPNWATKLRFRRKSQEAFDQRDCPVQGSKGHEFRLILRSNHLHPQDFSVLLVFKDADGTEYILRRHNGSHPSKHTNEYEKRHNLPNAELPICFHRHLATERYQGAGLRIDGYAERANDYNDIQTAQGAMVRDARLILPLNSQLSMLGDN